MFFIQNKFCVQGDERYEFSNPNPFIQPDEESEASSVAYRYRSWDLGNNQRIVIRCEQDCVQVGPNGEEQFVNIKALNEWNPKVEHQSNTPSIQIICILFSGCRWSRLAKQTRYAAWRCSSC